MRTGVIVFAHGSSVPSANDAVRSVAEQAARRGKWDLYETAFLEAAIPDLAAACDLLANKGAERVLVVPYFLTLGIHLQRDLPRIIDGIRGIHPTMDIRVTPPLDGHRALGEILVARSNEGLAAWEAED